MDDLAGGVHASIGAPCADHLNRFICDQRQRFLETLLHAQAGLLTLPAIVPGPVVFDAERDADIGPCASQR